MRKEKFVYNTHTLRYEKVVEPWSAIILRIFGFVCAALVTGFIFTLVSHRFFPSPKEKALLNEIQQQKELLGDASEDLERLRTQLSSLKDRDAYAYRMIFGMDPIDEAVWEGGVGGHDQYEQLKEFRHSGETMASVQQKIDKLKRQMVIQSKSLDTIMDMSSAKEKMLASMPSIKPVRSDKLNRGVTLLSGFGYRIHPIYKVPRMHSGIDFSAPKGTPIQATGAGKVVKAENEGNGYGLCVTIEHGYGYQTLYAHMSRIDVKVGQKVVRGQAIGLVGSSGASTAPHCHYEVMLRGNKVNPIHYVMDGLSPQEYQSLVKASETANQSFD
ncbi:MAG: peptidoglycan DD-metalloendopeptidase family protein [Saprospiraceae bacterium]|nr:peptidoglycan DD-metalloendopeptidase family protein [Saprospiraceae bacterium]